MSRLVPRTRGVSPLLIACLFLILSGGCGLAGKRKSHGEPAGDLAGSPASEESLVQRAERPPWRAPEDAAEDSAAPPPPDELLAAARDGQPVQPAGFSVELPVSRATSGTSMAPYVGTVTKVTTDDFSAVVLGSELPVLVDFYTEQCGPCKKMAPLLDQLAQETPDVRVVKVNIEDSRQLATTYRVRAVPTLMVFKQGVAVARHSGLADQAKLQQLLAQ